MPWVAVLVTFVVGALFFFPFPSWQKLVSYISSVTVLSYGIGPIVLLRLRSSMPYAQRPFRLWAPRLTAPLAFIVSNWIVFDPESGGPVAVARLRRLDRGDFPGSERDVHADGAGRSALITGGP